VSGELADAAEEGHGAEKAEGGGERRVRAVTCATPVANREDAHREEADGCQPAQDLEGGGHVDPVRSGAPVGDSRRVIRAEVDVAFRCLR